MILSEVLLHADIEPFAGCHVEKVSARVCRVSRSGAARDVAPNMLTNRTPRIANVVAEASQVLLNVDSW